MRDDTLAQPSDTVGALTRNGVQARTDVINSKTTHSLAEADVGDTLHTFSFGGFKGVDSVFNCFQQRVDLSLGRLLLRLLVDMPHDV